MGKIKEKLSNAIEKSKGKFSTEKAHAAVDALWATFKGLGGAIFSCLLAAVVMVLIAALATGMVCGVILLIALLATGLADFLGLGTIWAVAFFVLLAFLLFK